MHKSFTLLILLLLSHTILAYGPEKVASIDRSVVPIKITDRKSFDSVSRLEICFFVNELAVVSKWKEKKQFQEFLSNEKIDLPSIEQWTKQTQERLLTRYNASTTEQSLTSWDELTAVAKRTIEDLPSSYDAYRKAAKAFYESYLFEQVRLAGLFPRITSEIHTFDRSETQGFEYRDGEFLLTFDDGPTAAGSYSDSTINALNRLGVSALFFVLGEKLEKRIRSRGIAKLKVLYDGHRLESHGMVHKAHPTYVAWQSSLDESREHVNKIQPATGESWFRPPYGQRTKEQMSYLKKRNERIMLWNIDSQDWNRMISTKDMSYRVITLMLLWRSGIVLFHDVHPKAAQGLPAIAEFAKRAELKWVTATDL